MYSINIHKLNRERAFIKECRGMIITKFRTVVDSGDGTLNLRGAPGVFKDIGNNIFPKLYVQGCFSYY